MKRLPIKINIATTVTLIGLGFGVASIIFAINTAFQYAVVSLIVAGICDLLDGPIARKTIKSTDEGEFGKQIDSIVDVVNFGVAPPLIIYCFGMSDIIGITIIILYIISASLRLSYFNIAGLTENKGKRYYRGLPVTYSALLVPLIFLLTKVTDTQTILIIYKMCFVSLSMLYVLDISIPKPKGYSLIMLPLAAIVIASLNLI